MNKDDEYVVKNFKGVLILDWKGGSMRIIRKAPLKTKPFEIPIHLDMNIKIPKIPKIIAKGDFVVPPVKVQEMVLEEL